MENKSLQNKFWDELWQLKFDLYYLDICIVKSRKWENRINMYSAVMSSTSIGAWVIWRSLSFVWSILIAVSQIITAIKVYLPFSKQIKLLNEQYCELSMLFIDYDYLWFNIASGNLAEEDINDKLREFRSKKQLIYNKFTKQIQTPVNEKMIEKAMTLAEQYYS